MGKIAWVVAKERAEKRCVEKNLTLLSDEKEWNGTKTYLRVCCKEHGEYQVRYSNLTAGNGGYGCNKCGNKNRAKTLRKPTYQVVEDFARERYKVIGEYKGVDYATELECPEGHSCIISWTKFLKGSRCQECKENDGLSGGHRNVKLVLDELKLNYDVEFVAPQLPRMRYDFVVSLDHRAFLIEYDGRPHFEGWNGKKESKELLQSNDKKKTDLIRSLVDVDIYLIRISNSDKEHIKHTIERVIEDEDPPKVHLDYEEKYKYLC